MNLTQKNRIISKKVEEDIEIVEGELIDLPEETGIEKRRSTDIKPYGTIEFAAAIGTAALGLFKLFKIFSGGRSGRTPVKMRRRRRKR
ncbi:MAG: hypothetical protein KAS97_05930 [Candidatus Aminicenantes bacterium]|nr:hypothetical protein [Candidatus Aminicenantes bacterium]